MPFTADTIVLLIKSEALKSVNVSWIKAEGTAIIISSEFLTTVFKSLEIKTLLDSINTLLKYLGLWLFSLINAICSLERIHQEIEDALT